MCYLQNTEVTGKLMLQAYLGKGHGAFPMSPDVGGMNILENRGERATGAVWTGAVLTWQGGRVSCRIWTEDNGQTIDIDTDNLSNMAG